MDRAAATKTLGVWLGGLAVLHGFIGLGWHAARTHPGEGFLDVILPAFVGTAIVPCVVWAVVIFHIAGRRHG